jgi:hypothetical protein
VKKTLWTVNVDNYAPEMTALTHPLLKRYAEKCDAEFRVITERKFPNFPPVYEKLQVYELGKDSDWNIVIDSDAIVHPDMFDVTNHLSGDTVCHNANDMAGNRWKYDRFFARDGRHIGSCNWFTVGSNWCIELWKPLDDLTLEEAVANISPTVHERATHLRQCQNPQCRYEVPVSETSDVVSECTRCGQKAKRIKKAVIKAEHLIDDYTLSRNIAKYGLKFTTVRAIQEKLNERGFYLWHIYTDTLEEKLRKTKEVLAGWGIET